MRQIEKYFTKEYLMGPNSVRIAEELLNTYPLHLDLENTILELGCGTGLSSFYISNKTNASVHATDLWISEEENTDRFASWGTEGRLIPFCIDAGNTKFEHEKYDAVISIDSYHYFAGKAGFFVERILPTIKRGGTALIAVPGIKEEFEGKQQATIQEWTGEETYMFHSCSWWKNIIGTHPYLYRGNSSEEESLGFPIDGGSNIYESKLL